MRRSTKQNKQQEESDIPPLIQIPSFADSKEKEAKGKNVSEKTKRQAETNKINRGKNGREKTLLIPPT
ncbi:MAG: hypothetical protein Q6366_000465 [Candidatus Freyarchaeota archaeon]